mgnify:FL=1
MRQIHESGENYLEVILDIQRELGVVRSVEIARRVGVSRASGSKAVSVLRDMGLVEPAYYSDVVLTEAGLARAKEIRHRHDLLCHYLRDVLGVSPAVAEHDACRIEHVVSNELIARLEVLLAEADRAATPTKEQTP